MFIVYVYIAMIILSFMAPTACVPTQQTQIHPEAHLRRGSCIPAQQTQINPEALLRRGSLPVTPTSGNLFPKFFNQKSILMIFPEGPKPFFRFLTFANFREKVTELLR